MKLKTAPLLLSLGALFSLWAPVYSAKPKVEVRLKVNEGIGKYPQQDSLNKYNSPVAGPLMSNEIFYFNVVVSSDNADAVSQNKGQWCIKGDADLSSIEYHGTLSGNDLEVEVPQKNGKTKKASFAVYDHKLRKLSDL